jgi:hypothetical protein
MNPRSLFVGHACLLICVTTTAVAQDAAAGRGRPTSTLRPYETIIDGSVDESSISLKEAVWSLFAIVRLSEGKSPGSGAALLENAVGLTTNQATAMVQHITSSWADVNSFSRQTRMAACTNEQVFKTSQESLAAALNDLTQKVEQHRYGHIDELASVIGPEGAAKVSNWADAHVRGGVKMIKVDHAKRLAQVGNLEATVNRLCTSSGVVGPH